MTPATFISQLAFFHRKSLGNTEGLQLFNLIYQDTQNRAPWHWLEETGQLSAVDASLIDLPDDLRQVWEVMVDSDIYHPISYLDRTRYTNDSNPRKYYLLGKQIAFPGYSNAGASNNVDLTYIELGANLADVTESPLCPDTFDPFFVQQGVGLLWQREGNFGKAGNHLALSEQMMNGLVAENNKPIKGHMRKARHIEEFYPRNY